MKRDRRAAFTLVEALATLLLLAIVLPVAMRGISLAMASTGLAKQRMEAATLAQGKMDELLATGGWRNGGLAGDFSPDEPGYQWRADVSEWNGSTLQLLTVQVRWLAQGHERAVAFDTLVSAGEE